MFWKVMRRWWQGDQQQNPWTNLIEIFILADACCSWGSGKGVLDQVAHARVNRGNHIFPYWVNSMKPFSHQFLSPKIYLFIFHILLESKYLEFGFMAPSLLKSSLGVPAPNWVSPLSCQEEAKCLHIHSACWVGFAKSQCAI